MGKINLAADSLRIKAFSYVVAMQLGMKLDEISPEELHERLCFKDQAWEKSTPETCRRWLRGEQSPAKYTSEFMTHIPDAMPWLTPELSHPLRRFLCALDIWGSPIESALRGFIANNIPGPYSVGDILNVLNKDWAPVPISGESSYCYLGFMIPKLRREVSASLFNEYQITDPTSLLKFIFLNGISCNLNDIQLESWAIDLATATIAIKARIENLPIMQQLMSGKTGDIAALVYDFFFLVKDTPSKKLFLTARIADIEGVDHPDLATEKLILAKKILRSQLKAIGAELGDVETIFEKILDKNLRWSENRQQPDVSVSSNLLVHSEDFKPLHAGRYKYVFQHTEDKKKEVLCLDLESNESIPLKARHDLHAQHEDIEFSWGIDYCGSGPQLLAKSILAHHLGHDRFGRREVWCLLNSALSNLSEHWFMGPFFLTTDMIDHYLNHAEDCLSDAT